MTGKRAAGRIGAQPTILLDLFVAFQRSAQAVELSFAEHGLDVPDFAILSTIGVESPVTATTLAQRLGVSQRTMLFRVRRLVEQGLVARVRSENDRRAVELSLTAEGERLRSEARPIFRHLVQRVESRLADEPDAVQRAVRDLAEALSAEIAELERGRGAARRR